MKINTCISFSPDLQALDGVRENEKATNGHVQLQGRLPPLVVFSVGELVPPF